MSGNIRPKRRLPTYQELEAGLKRAEEAIAARCRKKSKKTKPKS
jgi:hypothetical protein